MTNKPQPPKWWGYLHISGSLQAKRYFDPLDLDEARESPFIRLVVPPFCAYSRDEALLEVRNKCGRLVGHVRDADAVVADD